MKSLAALSLTLASLLGGSTSLLAGGETFTAPEPEDLIIYHVFLDRFADGNPGNNAANPRTQIRPTQGTGWHGGDFAGVTQNLDYIAGLNVNGLWLSPFLEQVNNYHGYATFDFYKIDPNFGTLEELQTLISEANKRGIAVYFDMVAGHQAGLLTSDSPGYNSYLPPPNEYVMRWNSSLRYPPPFNGLQYFHAHGNIGNFFGVEQEIGELVDLDDLKTETPYVQEEMTKIWEFWLENTGVSGFRIDTVKHVDLGFWRFFLPRLQAKADELGRTNYFTFGEIYAGDDNFMSDYVGTLRGEPYKLDAALDFPFYYTVQGVFSRNNRPPSDLSGRIQAREAALGIHHLKMPNFIDNHDVPRFLNDTQSNPGSGVAEQIRRLELAFVAMFTLPGPPIVYYGTEQAFNGGFDPNNRENMFDGQFEFGPSLGDNFDTSHPLYELVANLSNFRNSLPALRRGGYTPHLVSTSGPGRWVYSRGVGENRVIVAMNTSVNSTGGTMDFVVADLAGKQLSNAFNPTQIVTVGVSGQVSLPALAGQGYAVWVRTDQVPPVPLSVVSTLPADGAVGVSTELEEVVVQFNQPMNTSTTTGAISVEPTVPFTVTWNPEGDTATLDLVPPLESRTNYTVAVSTAAQSAEGSNLRAAFTSTWITERTGRTLPPLPVALGTLRPLENLPTWPNTSSLQTNAAHFVEEYFVWNDALGDDRGPGTYTYPTNAVFTTGDADIERFAMAYDAVNVYFLLEQASINPAAGFYTTYWGIGLDLGESGRVNLGYNQQTGATGGANLLARPDA
ncbi:MAG: alpha-amylase family glycosyl hydrolase, partial [Candidatus Sumerlaeia bacterium]|nr:alpha-amylase family glycosyl hydrolase [Candidatus Sumerlaeia bacterium]